MQTSEQEIRPIVKPYVVFRNKGLIDLEAIKVLGISSKECESPIGHFGTGLKYAIAILLRNRQRVTIYRGSDRYEFGIRKTKVRVDKFEIVTMNGEDLGFTTDLGKNWDLWTAFRELYCNILDEPGGTCDIVYECDTDKIVPRHNETVIAAEGEEIADVYHNRSKYFAFDEPKYKVGDVWVHEKRNSDHDDKTLLFYKGVLVYEWPRRGQYRYNFQRRLDLTEDRTLKYTYIGQSRVAAAIRQYDNTDFITTIALDCDRNSFESEAISNNMIPDKDLYTLSPEFVETIGGLLEDGFIVNPDLRLLHERYIKRITVPTEYKLSNIQQARLAKAKELCRLLDFQALDDYEIRVVESLGTDMLGCADINSKVITLSSKAFHMGTKIIAGTLIEEYIHIKHLVNDETREMQNILIDLLVTCAETHILKEPL